MPRYGFTVSFNPPEISVLDWDPLERVSNLTFTPTQRTQLLAALNTYLECLCRQEAMASMEDVKSKITRIHTHATALARELGLSVTDDSNPGRAQNLQHAVLGEIFPFDHVDPTTFLRVLRQLVRNSKIWLEQPQRARHPGRPPEDGLRQLICTWHAVYRAAGGKGRGCYSDRQTSGWKGPFLEMLVVALHQVASSPQHSLPPEWVRLPRSRLGEAIRALPRKELTRDPQPLSWKDVTGGNGSET